VIFQLSLPMEAMDVICPECLFVFQASYVHLIDTGEPERVAALRSGLLNRTTCPSCSAEPRLDVLLVYHDALARLLIVALPEAAEQVGESEKVIATLRAKMPRAAYLAHPIVVVGQVPLRAILPYAADLAHLERRRVPVIVEALLQKDNLQDVLDAVLMWSAGRRYRNDMRRAAKWLSVARELTRHAADAGLSAAVAFQYGLFHDDQGEIDRAIKEYTAAVERYRQLGDVGREGMCEVNLGRCYQMVNAFIPALQAYERAEEIANLLQNQALRASVLANSAVVFRAQGRLAEAAVRVEEAIKIHRERDDMRSLGTDLTILGSVALASGDLDHAVSAFEEALRCHRSFKQREGQAAALAGLGMVAQRQGDLRQAERRYLAARALYREQGDYNGEVGQMINLAGLALLTGNLRLGRQRYRRAVTLSADASADKQIAALTGFAEALRRSGKFGEAYEILDGVLTQSRVLGLSLYAAQILSFLAAVRHDQGAVREALDLYTDAVQELEATGDQVGQTGGLYNVALMHADLGEWSKAEHVLSQADALAKGLQLKREQAAIYRTKGALARIRGAFDEAESLYRQALEIDEMVGDRAGEVASMQGLAGVYVASGRLSAAATMLHTALEQAQATGETALEAEQWCELATFHHTVGGREQAATCYQTALRLLRRAGSPQRQADVLGNLAILHAEADRLVEARSYLREAIGLYEAAGQPERGVRAIAYLGVIEQADGRKDVAQEYYDNAVALAIRAQNREAIAQAAHNRALLLQEQGRLQEARADHDVALEALGDLFAPHIRWRILSGRGSTRAASDDSSGAESDFKTAIDLIERVRSGLEEEHHRIGYFGDDPLSVYPKLVQHLVRGKQIGQAFDYVERSRSRAFLDRLYRLSATALGWGEVQQLLRSTTDGW
jgi:tetratricopeptide (TPR) repeat protein